MCVSSLSSHVSAMLCKRTKKGPFWGFRIWTESESYDFELVGGCGIDAFAHSKNSLVSIFHLCGRQKRTKEDKNCPDICVLLAWTCPPLCPPPILAPLIHWKPRTLFLSTLPALSNNFMKILGCPLRSIVFHCPPPTFAPGVRNNTLAAWKIDFRPFSGLGHSF